MLNLQRIVYSDPTWASLNIPSGNGQCHQPKRRTHWKLGSGQSTAPILGPHKWDLGFKHRLTDVPCHILPSTSFSLLPFLKPPPLRHLSLSLPPSRHSPSFAPVGIITLLDDCRLRMIGQLYQLLSVGEEGHTADQHNRQPTPGRSPGTGTENEIVFVDLQRQLLGRLLLTLVHHSQLLLHLAHATQELDDCRITGPITH
eukprot:Em0008g439a